ncbi:hypothetical protein HPO96_20820 [Kribbella sandramycini]|uniref:DNA primase DNAG catalytic core N-terminal domain-containing protein n=1 Tax=Kribbella sandramycini TaxID=60450 RepID=A0A7Y4P182_9ACTN|nr:hypothetical protein [Kribbella sandramycini]NOL42693.1 hypothetical protein [Kribbella sandramycini]
MSEPGYVVSDEERRRLLEANAAAAHFFRRELLRTGSSWPGEYLRARGAEDVLTVNADWKVGYAPDTWTSLTEHLHGKGFSNSTLVKAGLIEWNAQGDAVDRHRDRLMLVARDHGLSPVGFIGIGQDGQARSVSPVTAIYRPTNVLTGIEEQLDLLAQGAVPVIVDDPADAIAVTKLSREFEGQWAGIPVCEGGLSTAQARMVRRYSLTDKAIVVTRGTERSRQEGIGHVFDLSYFFDRVRVLKLTMGISEAVVRGGATEQLVELLSGPRRFMDFRVSEDARGGLRAEDLDPPDRGPGLG